jgi:hypothetical protein
MLEENVRPPKSIHSLATFVEFVDTRVHPAPNERMAQFKVWEDPEPDGAVYIIGGDPAGGSREGSDCAALQVLRCYADGCDQVAEYAWPLHGTKQFAWAILAIAGWYATGGNDIRLIIELNGPGRAVWDEILSVRRHISSGYQPREVDDLGLKRVFHNVKNYIYTRNDSLSPGKSLQWNTSNTGGGHNSKIRIMERFRDAVSVNMVHIRSATLLDEMRGIQREGDKVGAQGKGKDDRTIAMALALHYWGDYVRPMLSSARRTRESEYSKRKLTMHDMNTLYMQYRFQDMFKRKAKARSDRDFAIRMARRGYR